MRTVQRERAVGCKNPLVSFSYNVIPLSKSCCDILTMCVSVRCCFVFVFFLWPASVTPQENIPPGAATLAFVFDITGSMYDDLVQVIDGAAKIMATTLARIEKPLYNYVLVPFHDPGM